MAKQEEDKRYLNIRIGALSPKLHEQINEQVWFEVSAEDVEFEQRLVDAVVLLQIKSIITFGEQKKVGNRVMKHIMERVEELGKAARDKTEGKEEKDETSDSSGR